MVLPPAAHRVCSISDVLLHLLAAHAISLATCWLRATRKATAPTSRCTCGVPAPYFLQKLTKIKLISGLQASQVRIQAEERHKAAAAREAALTAEAERLEAAKRQVATGGVGLVSL